MSADGGTMSGVDAATTDVVAETSIDPAIQAKKKLIRDVARSLFIEHGYERVSVDEISAQARVSKATLYALFRSKDELLCEIFAGEVLEKTGRIAEQCARIADPFERLQASITLALETSASNEFMCLILSQLDGTHLPIWTNSYARQVEPIIVRRYAEPLQACIDAKAIRPVDVEMTAYLIYRLIQAVSVASNSGQYPAAALREQLLDLVVHGLRR